MTIPVIDLRHDRDEVVRALDDAGRHVGFAMVVGHGVDRETTARVFAASAAFHALAIDQKMSIELDARHRGYIPVGVSTDRTSSVDVVETPNQSASFMMMRDDAPDAVEVAAGTYLAGPNQWPDLSGFRDAVESYHDALVGVGERVVTLFGELLHDHDRVVQRAFETPTTWLRLLHYPSRPATEGVFGSAPHRDFGCITLLAQDDVGGLQVRTASGDWIDVPPRPDALVLNVGDMLHRWSNGRLLSTPHRVVTPSGRSRLSVAFFFDPHMSTVVEPLRSCVGEGEAPRFEPVEFATFVRDQLEATYDHHAG